MDLTKDGLCVTTDLPIAIAICVAHHARAPASSPAFEAALAEVIAAAPPREADPMKAAVRTLLRHGKYKPTGRGKPASEYLWQSAVAGEFPRVFPLVDVCNLVSLRTLLPISLVDLTRADTLSFCVRRGRAGESYVFNAGGQEIALEDLLLLARLPSDTPCANAVKDSLATKLTATSQDVLAVVYAPADQAALAQRAATEMGDWFTRDFGAEVFF